MESIYRGTREKHEGRITLEEKKVRIKGCSREGGIIEQEKEGRT